MCPPFQVLVMSEESRLGREAIETAYAPKQFVTAGVRVFVYLEDRERTFDSPTDKLLMSLRRRRTRAREGMAADVALLSRTPTACPGTTPNCSGSRLACRRFPSSIQKHG